MQLALMYILSSILFRIPRGGPGGPFWKKYLGFEIGSTVARLGWAIPTAVLLAWVANDWWLVLAFPFLFLSLLMGWGSYMRPGRRNMPAEADNEVIGKLLQLVGLKDGSLVYDIAGMAVRGLYLVTVCFVGIASIGFVSGHAYYLAAPFLLIALLNGLVYWAWQFIGDNFDLPRIGSGEYEVIGGYTSYAELTSGLLYAIVLSLLVL